MKVDLARSRTVASAYAAEYLLLFCLNLTQGILICICLKTRRDGACNYGSAGEGPVVLRKLLRVKPP